MLVSQQTETRALSEKLATLDLEKVLISAMADGSVCKYVLNNPTELTFDSTAALPQLIILASTTVNPAKLYSNIVPGTPPTPGSVIVEVGTQASPVANSLIVQSILLEITAGAGNTYTGNWFVKFDPTKTVRPIKPVSILTTLIVDKTNPSATKIIGCSHGIFSFESIQASSSCASSSGCTATATCPIGKTLLTGSCSVSGGGPANTFIAEDQQSGNGWYCNLWNASAAANTVQATAVCY
jgi:hypothetical protein